MRVLHLWAQLPPPFSLLPDSPLTIKAVTASKSLLGLESHPSISTLEISPLKVSGFKIWAVFSNNMSAPRGMTSWQE